MFRSANPFLCRQTNRRILIFVVFAYSMLIASVPRAEEPDFTLEKYTGKVVYVDFWASWCTPCRASFPFMNELKQEFGDDLVIAAINLDKKRDDADQFLSNFDVGFEIYYNPTGSLAENFGLKGMPTSYLYGRDGQVLGEHVGFRKKDENKLRAAIAAAMNL